MLTGWDADDYRVHFDPNHWQEVKARLGMALPREPDLSFGLTTITEEAYMHDLQNKSC